MKLDTIKQKQDCTGFTMVEVLVAIVVLAVGLLGLAGLQATSLKNNRSSYSRTQAQLLAYDMLDRMRSNRSGVANGNYDNLLGTTPNDPNCISSGCTIAQLAEFDAFEWSALLLQTLPSGTGSVKGSGKGSIFTITVMWDDNNATDLTCFTLSSTL